MKKKILVIKLGDNDFLNSLTELGEYLLNFVGFKVMEHLSNRDELNTFLSDTFKSILTLYQHRFDMFIEYSNIQELQKSNEEYLTLPYFNIRNSEFKLSYENEEGDGDTLIIDFYNNQVFVI